MKWQDLLIVFLGFSLRLEPGLVDDKPLVDALPHQAVSIVDGNLEDEPPAVNLNQFAVTPYRHSEGRRGYMTDIYVGADSFLAFIKKWLDTQTTSLFDKGDHHWSCEYENRSAADVLGGFGFGDSQCLTSFYSGFNHIFLRAGWEYKDNEKSAPILNYDSIFYLCTSIPDVV